MWFNLPGILIGALLAAAVSFAALTAAAGSEQRTLDLAVPPFGWTRVVVVHLLAALPFNVLAALLLRSRTQQRPSRLATVFAVVVGIVVALATVAGGLRVGMLLDEAETGFTVRLVVRVLWCLALELPWCWFGACLPGAAAPAPRGVAGLLALAAAVLLPFVYTSTLIETQTRKAEEKLHVQRLRLTQAQPLVEGLSQLGSSQLILGKLPPEVRREARAALERYQAAAARPVPATLSAKGRIRRAELLEILGRLDEAQRTLEPLSHEPAILLKRGELLRELRRWKDSDRCYRSALDLLGLLAADPAVRPLRVKAYDDLAANARERQAYHEAEALYHEALEIVPEEQAHWHLQLGRHYRQGGRFNRALEHLHTAVQLDPALGASVQPLLDELALHTPGCFLRRSTP